MTVSDFSIAKTEVTKAQWDAVRAWAVQHGYTDLPVGRNGSQPAGTSGTHPVTEVAWFDALKWCNAKSEMEGRTPSYSFGGQKVYRTGPSPEVPFGASFGLVSDWRGDGYRLPTEAEWEYACRAGTATAFSTGPVTVGEKGVCSLLDPNLDKAGWYCGNSGGATHPVGQKQPNAWGLYDMHGNAMEWCSSFYGPYGSSPQTDPIGVPGGTDVVLRGGNFGEDAVFCRSAMRFALPADVADVHIGFRVVTPGALAKGFPVIRAQTARTAYGACPE
ncbi:MAG: formylglycine-generating enzyme family protein, partial [Candidatus Liptonbacteria bacterium]|nr:formylglycine-generating enzyme family protein [Candidatus Liptonbacteria bacterium]